jgi:hypothetical protein
MRGFRTGLALVAVFLLFGCPPERTLVRRTDPSLPDVPVPFNFKFDPSKSNDFASQTSKDRLIVYHYTGRSYAADVLEFYKQQMPVEGWRIQDDVGTAGQRTLFFKKTGIDPARTPMPSCWVTIFSSGEYAKGVRIVRTEK